MSLVTCFICFYPPNPAVIQDFSIVYGKVKKVGHTQASCKDFCNQYCTWFMFLCADTDTVYFLALPIFTFHPFPQGMVVLLETPNGLTCLMPRLCGITTRLCWEVAEFPSPEVFKRRVDMAQRDMV